MSRQSKAEASRKIASVGLQIGAHNGRFLALRPGDHSGDWITVAQATTLENLALEIERILRERAEMTANEPSQAS